jgi:hypothetical protein
MDYCFGGGDGTASMWTGSPDVDVDGDGTFDGVALDFDGDGLPDDALVDLDDDGIADHAVLDFGGEDPEWFTDDGSGTWAIAATPQGGPQLRWFGLDGIEQVGGPQIDIDGDGTLDDLLVDTDSDGLADRVVSSDGSVGFVDVDGDGRWDVRLVDADADGAADDASQL